MQPPSRAGAGPRAGSTQAPTADSANAEAAQAALEGPRQVPFQPSVFKDFVALIGRLFYDDACIVLLDFLAREQKAFTEQELRDRLKWREALVQKKLANLEKQLLVEKYSEMERGAKSLQYWRIPQHLFIAVEFRLRALEDKLKARLHEASKQTSFQCPNPDCGIQVPILEAVAGPKALEDDHPLCRMCGSKLTTADAEEAKREADSRLKRFHEQVTSLRDLLRRVHDMAIPVFTVAGSATMDAEAAAIAAAEREAAIAAAAKTAEAGPPRPPETKATPTWFQTGSQVPGAPSSGVSGLSGVGSVAGTGPGGLGARPGGSVVGGTAGSTRSSLPSFGTAASSQPSFGLRGPVPGGGPAKLPTGFGGLSGLGTAGARRIGPVDSSSILPPRPQGLTPTQVSQLLPGLSGLPGATPVGGSGSQVGVRSGSAASSVVAESSEVGASKPERSPLKLQFGSGASGVGGKPFSVSLAGGHGTTSPSSSAAGREAARSSAPIGSLAPLTPGGKRRLPATATGTADLFRGKRIRF